MDRKNELKREIGLFGGISILTGIMVGSGIFFIGSFVLLRTDFSVGLSLLIWIIGGVITLLYGLIYAELGASMPEAGGYYIYLKKAYGKPLAFMSGFTNFIIISSASIAVLATVFPVILSNIFWFMFGFFLPDSVIAIIAISMIIGLSVLNYFGIKVSAFVLKVLLIAKAIPIFTVLILGFVLGTQSIDLSLNLGNVSIFSVLSMIGFAVIATFWAYEGWTNLNNVAGEIKKPGINLPLSLIITVASVTVLYTLYNMSIFRVLSLADIQGLIANGEIFLGISAAATILGSFGMYLIMFTMLISVFGALNGTIMTFPRVYYAMSKDGLLFNKFKFVHPKYKTPYYAIIGSGIMAILLTFVDFFFDNGLDTLISLVAFGALFFNTLIFASIFIFRKKEPELNRPYKVWGYPYLPVITILITIGLLVATFIEAIVPSLIGTGIILLGLPVYYLIERKKS